MRIALIYRALLAPIFGVGLCLSFAPAQAWWFAPVCLAGLWMLIETCGALAAAVIGLCFGVGWFGAGFWWMMPGIRDNSAAGVGLALALTIALVLYMSLYPAIACGLLRWLSGTDHSSDRRVRRWRCVLAAALWTLSEWARGQFFGGVPWLTTGYAQSAGPLHGLAPLIGVFGLTFVTAWMAAEFMHWLLDWTWPDTRADRLSALVRQCLFPGALLLLGGAGVLLGRIDWTEATGNMLTVRLLQGNLPQQEKFSQAGFAHALSTYETLTENSSAALTVLPETALSLEWFSLPPVVVAHWQALADQRNSTIVLGAVVALTANAERVSNSALALLPGASATPPQYGYRYDKEKLIPIGEAMPSGLEWLSSRLQLDYATFTAGTRDQPPLSLNAGKIAIGICFEDLFDTIVADKARDAGVLLNITNFAWFTHTTASAQHLQVGQMRALETGRWFMQAANTGLTALVDPHGVVRAVMPGEETGALDGSIPMRRGATPFMRWQNRPLLFFIAVLLSFALLQKYAAIGRRCGMIAVGADRK